MSCGDPHDVDCTEVLDQVYEYLHHELDESKLAKIQQHLDECSPCLQQYGLEQAVRDLVLRACSCQSAPESLRLTIMSRITQVRVEGTA